jgi:hypothetical protein
MPTVRLIDADMFSVALSRMPPRTPMLESDRLNDMLEERAMLKEQRRRDRARRHLAGLIEAASCSVNGLAACKGLG